MNIKFWMAGFLVIPKVYAVVASPFSKHLPTQAYWGPFKYHVREFWGFLEPPTYLQFIT